MDPLIEAQEQEFEKIFEHLKTELRSLRTGRANPGLVENILVEAYAARTPLKQLASITLSSARSIVIQPWDKSIMKEIEKSLYLSELGLSLVNEGSLIRANLPPLTEESRQALIKLLHEKLEQTRISLRRLRDKIREEIILKERSGQLTQDDKYRLFKELDQETSLYNEKVIQLGEDKEKEIMTI